MMYVCFAWVNRLPDPVRFGLLLGLKCLQLFFLIFPDSKAFCPVSVVVEVSASVTVTTSTAQGLRVTISCPTSAPIPVHPCAMSPHIAVESVQSPPHHHHFAPNRERIVFDCNSVTLTPCQRLAKPCNSSDKIQGFSCLTAAFLAWIR